MSYHMRWQEDTDYKGRIIDLLYDVDQLRSKLTPKELARHLNSQDNVIAAWYVRNDEGFITSVTFAGAWDEIDKKKDPDVDLATLNSIATEKDKQRYIMALMAFADPI